MRRNIAILSLIISAIGLFFFAGWSRDSYSSEKKAETAGKPGSKLVIAHAEIFGKLERPSVLFDHGKHTEVYKKEGCKTCHPRDGEENLLFAYPFKIIGKDKKAFMNAYHEKCIVCHQKSIAEKKKAGPVICGECHVKKSEQRKSAFPVVVFDFAFHDQHVRKFNNKCDPCHHSYDEEDKELVYEQGTEQSCSYCHDEKKQRGPSLAAERGAIEKKGLTMRSVSHAQCVNCHLFYTDRGLKAGPLECAKCHTGKYKSVRELADIRRPDRDQPKRSFITIEDGKMKGVPFNHEFHQKNTGTCRACHHETLNACKKCHGLTGRPEGKWINVADAYHDVQSGMGCAGCHKTRKSGKDCAGCHHHLLDVDLQSKGPQKSICSVCHNGKKEGDVTAKSIAPAVLDTEKVPENVTIKILEREYEPSEFPHRKIIQKLIIASNESKLATYFHRNMQTICDGCHHQSRADAEVQKGKPPYCRNCHSITFDSRNINRPRLLAAYHRQCLGCHQKMGLKQTGCKDCHKEKTVRPKDILSGTEELLSGKGG
jgi:hypothetical protein